MPDDDYKPLPVPPPEPVRAIGPAVGKPPGIQAQPMQPTFSEPPTPMERFEEWRDDPSRHERSERGKRAWETRRANAAHELPDRHFTGSQHPYDIALSALRLQISKIQTVIKTLEELKGGRL